MKVFESTFPQNSLFVITNKEFWGKVKPALSEHNPTIYNTNIILQEGNDLISDDNKISEILNNQYIYMVEISTGSAPKTLGEVGVSDKQSVIEYINKIVGHYNEHPSITKIVQLSKFP